MITPTDRELLISLAGSAFVNTPGKMPDGFMEEYELRLSMLSRAGVSQTGIGAHMLMLLLREFKVSRPPTSKTYAVNNWRKVEAGARIVHENKKGSFVGVSGDGMILVKHDGHRAVHEVSGSSVELSKPIVEGVNDEAFEDKNDPPTARAKLLEKEENEKDDVDEVFMKWSAVESGEEVEFTHNGERVAGEYIDLDDENNVLIAYKDETLKLHADLVEIKQAVS